MSSSDSLQFKPTRIEGLDGIRALAVVGVVWHHSHPGFASIPATSKGFLGVDVFFVLSGFLITHLLLIEQRGSGTISLRRFFVRRSLRIFPLYYAVLLAMAVYFFFAATHSSQAAQFAAELPFHATYTSNWIRAESMMAITWSLSTEEQFYLVWPMLFLLLGPWSLIVLVPFLGLNQAINFGLLDKHLAELGIPYASHEILQSTFTPLILGVLLAFCIANERITRFLRLFAHPLILICLVLGMILVLGIEGDIRGWPRLTFHILTMALLAIIVVQPKQWLTKLLEARPVAYIGVISYGIYLTHMIGIDLARRALSLFDISQPELLFSTALVLTIGISALSYRYFEHPVLKWKDRFR